MFVVFETESHWVAKLCRLLKLVILRPQPLRVLELQACARTFISPGLLECKILVQSGAREFTKSGGFKKQNKPFLLKSSSTRTTYGRRRMMGRRGQKGPGLGLRRILGPQGARGDNDYVDTCSKYPSISFLLPPGGPHPCEVGKKAFLSLFHRRGDGIPRAR